VHKIGAVTATIQVGLRVALDELGVTVQKAEVAATASLMSIGTLTAEDRAELVEISIEGREAVSDVGSLGGALDAGQSECCKAQISGQVQARPILC